MVTAGILPFRENSHGRTGNRTRDLMISSQRLWPLDHEAGHKKNKYKIQEKVRLTYHPGPYFRLEIIIIIIIIIINCN